MNRALCSSVATVLLLCGWTAAQDKDLRDQYGTRSLEAAQKIKQAIDAAEQKQFPKAQAAIDAALKADPNSQMAQFWRGIILSDIGDIDEALKSLEKAVTAGAPPSKYISVQAATNRGLLLGRLKRYDESNHWFSRALLEDPLDREKGRWVAYRNMAINLQAQGQFYSAAVAALLALESNPEKVDRAMIRAFAEKATSANQEVVRVFFRDDKTALPKPAPRAAKTELIGVDDRDLGIPEEAQQVLADPQGRYILALVVKGAQFYRVRTDGEPGVTKVPVEGTILAGALAGGTLFAVLDSPPRLIEISPESGKVLRTHPLGQRAATSVAALPARGLAFLSIGGILHRLDLASDVLTDLKHPCTKLAGTPAQDSLVGYVKDEDHRSSDGVRTLLINGRPVLVHSLPDPANYDWNQSSLVKYVPAGATVLLEQLRDNAGANANDVVISPDGAWVAVVAGGGWRSPVAGAKGGYVVPVYSTADFGHVQGAFNTDAYPRGCAFNPVTAQVAAVRNTDLRVYSLAGTEADATYKGAFAGPCAFSGNGRYLLLANSGKGLTLLKTDLTADEAKLATIWWKAIQVSASGPVAASGPAPVAKAMPLLAAFAPADDRPAVSRALAEALTKGSTDRPITWKQYGPYAEATKALLDIVQDTASKDAAGVRIYRIKEALKKFPDNPVLLYHMGDAQRAVNQTDAAQKAFLDALHSDCGRTELSVEALNDLAKVLTGQKHELQAIHCLAMSLRVDRAHPPTIDQLCPLLEGNKFAEEAARLKALGTPASAPGTDLPALPAPDETAKKMDADKLFASAAGSVVLVQGRDGTGSGVCVGKSGIILTNLHVVSRGGKLCVYPYEMAAGKLKRLDALEATVIFESRDADLAVLQVSGPPASLVPLPVAAGSPKTGERVYAIGNPGLGKQLLEGTITEGLVSGERTVEKRKYLQHSAAINPGNSGGPLLNALGQVVGLNTLVADLNNVGFAIPAEVVRSIFPSK